MGFASIESESAGRRRMKISRCKGLNLLLCRGLYRGGRLGGKFLREIDFRMGGLRGMDVLGYLKKLLMRNLRLRGILFCGGLFLGSGLLVGSLLFERTFWKFHTKVVLVLRLSLGFECVREREIDRKEK